MDSTEDGAAFFDHPLTPPPPSKRKKPDPPLAADYFGSRKRSSNLKRPSRGYGSSESLPFLVPPPPRPSTPSIPRGPSTPPRAPSTPPRPPKTSRGTGTWLKIKASPKPLTVNQRENESGLTWTAIRAAGVPVYLCTPGLDTLALCPSALGTYCSPTVIPKTIIDPDVFLHAYAAGEKLTKKDLTSRFKGDTGANALQITTDLVLAQYGAALIEQNSGQHFTFISVNRKNSVTSDMIIRRARELVQRFQDVNITKDKLVVTIPATEVGINATRTLAQEDGMLINSSMITGVSHASVCVEAGASWITFHLDPLEKVYKNREEVSEVAQNIQTTIALFHMHNVNTKIMISELDDIRRILDFPGAHGFCLTKGQIDTVQLPTRRPCRIPPQSPSSLPKVAFIQAEGAEWPSRYFDDDKVGASERQFSRYLPSRLYSILLMNHVQIFDHTARTLREFSRFVRDHVLIHRARMIKYSDPKTSEAALACEGAKALKGILKRRKDLRSAEDEWMRTLTGRYLPDVLWVTANVGGCDVWTTTDGKALVAQIPEHWDRREAASMDVYASE